MMITPRLYIFLILAAIMKFLILVLVIFPVQRHTHGLTYQQKLDTLSFYEPGSDYCYSGKKITLEVVFLLDRSSSTVLREIPKLIEMADEIIKEYEGSRVGLAMYSDFNCRKWKTAEQCKGYDSDGAPHHEDAEGCYTFGNELTGNVASLRPLVQENSIKFLASGGKESGFAALMMAAADLKIGWSKGSYVDDRFDRAKIVFLISDAGSNCCRKSENTTPPKGDGSDLCQNIENPNITFVGEILRKNEITPFLLLTKNAISDWKTDAQNLSVMFEVAELTGKPDTAKIMDHFREFVLDIQLAKGPVGCADPPGYNTLGY